MPEPGVGVTGETPSPLDVLRQFVMYGPQGGRRHGKTAVAAALAQVADLVERLEKVTLDRNIVVDSLAKVEARAVAAEERAADIARGWTEEINARVAAEAERDTLRQALESVGNLLFGTWEVPPDPPFNDRLREAESIARAVLAGEEPT